jgi:NAD(P)-dependent dehydrogenase (short-subunit alcohol dehydrogenase family)
VAGVGPAVLHQGREDPLSRFSGQVVLVTGASSGIGAALAREFARHGADLVLAARRVDRLETVRADVERAGRRALTVACDVTVDGDVDRAAERARRTFGRVDVVVANAGYGVVGPVERLTVEDFRRQFETNVFGVLRTVYATLADLKASRGRLVIIGSVNGHVAPPGTAPYAMSKFAVRALAEALGHELAPAGVSVVLISPGFVASEIRQVDNRGVWHPEPATGPPRWLVMPAGRAAQHIVRAVARRRREAVITGHGKFAVFVQRHLPGLVAMVLRGARIRGRGEPAAARTSPAPRA